MRRPRFLIESSKDLKPDYVESSAQTLILMSQILSTIAAGSPVNGSVASISGPPAFTPTSSAIAVNILWFLALSFSVAVSLISLLAREWLASFTTGMAGGDLRAGRVRQQRWDGIKRWRMRGILHILPFMIHASVCESDFNLK